MFNSEKRRRQHQPPDRTAAVNIRQHPISQRRMLTRHRRTASAVMFPHGDAEQMICPSTQAKHICKSLCFSCLVTGSGVRTTQAVEAPLPAATTPSASALRLATTSIRPSVHPPLLTPTIPLSNFSSRVSSSLILLHPSALILSSLRLHLHPFFHASSRPLDTRCSRSSVPTSSSLPNLTCQVKCFTDPQGLFQCICPVKST